MSLGGEDEGQKKIRRGLYFFPLLSFSFPPQSVTNLIDPSEFSSMQLLIPGQYIVPVSNIFENCIPWQLIFEVLCVKANFIHAVIQTIYSPDRVQDMLRQSVAT